MDNLLTLRYVQLDRAALFDKNIKKHDLGKIAESFRKHGFKSACKWESTLNNGRGGIVAGNGRIETLLWMHHNNERAPKGITVDREGNWYVPVLFGVDSDSELAARAYALDDNNLTLMGAEFTALDISKLYGNELLAELQELADAGEFAVSFDGDDIDLLMHLDEPENDRDFDDDDEKPKHKCPNCGFEY